VERLLGPAPAWFTKEQTVGNVRFHVGAAVARARVEDHRVNLRLADRNGAETTLTADHVIAATGYQVDLRRLRFLDPELLSKIRTVEHTPILSAGFESSVPDLYFVGTSAANTFGPLMRFVFGTEFTARRIVRHLAPKRAAAKRHSTPGSTPTPGATPVSGSVRDRVSGGVPR
jgi:thioredoxin reductase